MLTLKSLNDPYQVALINSHQQPRTGVCFSRKKWIFHLCISERGVRKKSGFVSSKTPVCWCTIHVSSLLKLFFAKKNRLFFVEGLEGAAPLATGFMLTGERDSSSQNIPVVTMQHVCVFEQWRSFPLWTVSAAGCVCGKGEQAALTFFSCQMVDSLKLRGQGKRTCRNKTENPLAH